jgi:hypothetical protein
LTEEEQAAIEAHGLFKLSDFLPKKPSEAELKVMKEMFEASVDGQPYDPDRWGAYFRPAGVAAPAGSSTGGSASAAEEAAPAPVTKAAPVSTSSFDDEDEVAAPTAPVAKPAAGGNQNAQDILAMIRARQNK